MHRQLIAKFNELDDLADITQIQTRVDALRIQVQGERHDIDVAGPLSVAEKRTFDAIGAGHDRQLGRRDRRSAIVVRVHGKHDLGTIRDAAQKPFDLIGVNIGRAHLDRRGQIDDDAILAARAPTSQRWRRRSRRRNRVRCR